MGITISKALLPQPHGSGKALPLVKLRETANLSLEVGMRRSDQCVCKLATAASSLIIWSLRFLAYTHLLMRLAKPLSLCMHLTSPQLFCMCVFVISSFPAASRQGSRYKMHRLRHWLEPKIPAPFQHPCPQQYLTHPNIPAPSLAAPDLFPVTLVPSAQASASVVHGLLWIYILASANANLSSWLWNLVLWFTLIVNLTESRITFKPNFFVQVS